MLEGIFFLNTHVGKVSASLKFPQSLHCTLAVYTFSTCSPSIKTMHQHNTTAKSSLKQNCNQAINLSLAVFHYIQQQPPCLHASAQSNTTSKMPGQTFYHNSSSPVLYYALYIHCSRASLRL